MTHCVGVLVVSELQQCGAVLPLPGFLGALTVTTLASVCLHAAVLPHAARAAPTAWWDVFLVTVSCDGGGSVLREKTVRKWKTCLSSHSLCCTRWPVFISLTLDEMLSESRWWGQPFIYIHLFLQLMSCLVSMLILFTFYLLSPLIDIFSCLWANALL